MNCWRISIPGLSHGSGGAPILTYTPPVVTTTSSKAPGYTPPPVTITTTTQSNAQPPTVTALHLAGDSPLTHGSVEYAKFQSWGIDISIIPPKYPTSIPIYWNSQMSDAQCLTLCQRTAGERELASLEESRRLRANRVRLSRLQIRCLDRSHGKPRLYGPNPDLLSYTGDCPGFFGPSIGRL